MEDEEGLLSIQKVKMNSIQRFENAMQRKPTDRVPVLSKIYIPTACKLTGISPLEAIADPTHALSTICQASKDTRSDGARLFIFPKRQVRQEENQVVQYDSSGRRMGRLDMTGGWMTTLESNDFHDLSSEEWIAHLRFYRLENDPFVNDIQDVEKIAIPSVAYYKGIGYDKIAKKILSQAGNSLCCIGDCDTPTMSFLVTLRGMNQAMMDIVMEPELVHACFRKGVDISFEQAKFWLDQGAKVLRLNDSTANMNVISPKHFREFVAPYFKQFCTRVHEYREDALIYCHICGNILPIIEDLIDTGLDCIGPLDPLGGMTVAQVREIAGDRIALMGGVNTLSLLNGPPESIREESLACIRMNAGQPGYILGSGCVVPPDSPLIHLRAMAEASETAANI